MFNMYYTQMLMMWFARIDQRIIQYCPMQETDLLGPILRTVSFTLLLSFVGTHVKVPVQFQVTY